MNKEESENPLLEDALKLIESTAQEALTDPKKAMRIVEGEIGWIEFEKCKDLSISQIKTLKSFEAFEGLNLIQIKTKLSEESVREGPIAESIARNVFIPSLEDSNIRVNYIPYKKEQIQPKTGVYGPHREKHEVYYSLMNVFFEDCFVDWKRVAEVGLRKGTHNQEDVESACSERRTSPVLANFEAPRGSDLNEWQQEVVVILESDLPSVVLEVKQFLKELRKTKDFYLSDSEDITRCISPVSIMVARDRTKGVSMIFDTDWGEDFQVHLVFHPSKGIQEVDLFHEIYKVPHTGPLD